MPRLLVATVLAMSLFALPAQPALADTSANWFATYGRDLFTASLSGDSLPNDPRSFNPQSSMYLQTPGWDASIELRTTVTPDLLHPFPVVTPTPPSLPGQPYVYRWDSPASSSFQSVFLQDSRPVSLPPGVTLSREMVGGRQLAAGETVDREFRATIHMVQSSPAVSASVVFTPFFVPPGSTLAVVASNVSCPTGSTSPGNPGYVSWYFSAPAAGTDLTLTCTVRLHNTTSAAARYTPALGVRVERSSSSYPPITATDVGTDDPALEGFVLYHVTPPAGVTAEAHLDRYEAFQLGLDSENVADVPVPWSAQYTENRFFGTSEDVVADAVRPYDLSWQFFMQRPFNWGGGVSITTGRDTSGWFFSPNPTSVMGTSPKTYRWEQPGGFVSAYVSSMGFGERLTVPSSIGLSVSRESVGGTSLAPGLTTTRSFVVRLVGSTDTKADVSIFINSGVPGTPEPVTVTGQTCAGGTVLGGLPGGFGWTSLALPQGVEVRLNCSATLTNTAATAAVYKPVVIVTRSSAPVETSGYANEIAFSAGPLGSVSFAVIPPNGTEAAGTLSSSVSHQIFMNPTNRAPIATQLTYTGATTALPGQPVTLSARLGFATFGIVARTLHFQIDGTTYDATTDLSGTASVTLPSGLAPGAHPVTAAFDGDDFFMASLTGASIEVQAPPTTLAYAGDSAATFGFARVSAHLIDTGTGAPLGGKTVAFTVDGIAAGSALTNATGDATLTVAAQRLLAGSHAIGVAFAGDATHAASNASGLVAIRYSAVKVNAEGVTPAGTHVQFSAKSDGTAVSGEIEIQTATRTFVVTRVIALGASADGLMAVAYGRTAAGEDVVIIATDAGRADRIVTRLNGSDLTGDGTLREGTVKLKF